MKSKRRVFGTFIIFVGLSLVISALFLLLYNYKENRDAEEASASRLKLVNLAISDRVAEQAAELTDSLQNRSRMGLADEMTVVTLDGEDYIGYFSAPSINLEMPVMAQWNDENLKKSLCCYYGSTEEKNLVIAGHNYSSGFGKLRKLKIGDQVYFTNMNGKTYNYTVEEIEILNATDVKKMIESDWELSLYTCTYNGKQRVTVRCREVE